MKIIITGLLAIFLSFSFQSPVFAEPMKATGTVEVFFSPHGGVTDAIIKEIDGAKKEVLVQAYSFTSSPIAKALLIAHKRGVNVEVVVDKGRVTERYTEATFLKNSGIAVWSDEKHAIAHNKIMIIDKNVVITGSFNFTKAAENSNAENLLIIKDNKPLTFQYLQNFGEHKGHSIAVMDNK